MTKQEEIREAVYQTIKKHREDAISLIADEILVYLHSQGVLIKVDRELPPQNNRCLLWDLYQKGWLESQQTMKLAGYVAVESLLKEKDD